MKPALLNAYAEMLPRLQAEEALLARPVIASSTGNMKRGEASTFVKQLRRLAKMDRGQTMRTVGDLAKAGLPVIRTKRGGEKSNG
jgi:hypothetical protein